MKKGLLHKVKNDFLWVERYRPTTVEDCILPDSIKNVFKGFVSQKEIPNLLLSGSAGVGFYDQIKKSCINHGIISIFASEINEELNLENKIQYINNLQPTLFVSFNNSEEESVNFFKGRFSESVVGKKVAEHLSETLKIESIGKSSNILKETKSVGVVINGKFYQKLEIDNLIQSLVDSLKNQFEN